MYNLRADYDLQVKFASLTGKVETLKLKMSDYVKSVQDISSHVCNSIDHFTQNYPTLLALKEVCMNKRMS